MQCRFSIFFGLEVNIRLKYIPVINVQFWRSPFRYDNIESHLKNKHPWRWPNCTKLTTTKAWSDFFENCSETYHNTLPSHSVSDQICRSEMVLDCRDIVDLIVGDMFFSSEDYSQCYYGPHKYEEENMNVIELAFLRQRSLKQVHNAQDRAPWIFQLKDPWQWTRGDYVHRNHSEDKGGCLHFQNSPRVLWDFLFHSFNIYWPYLRSTYKLISLLILTLAYFQLLPNRLISQSWTNLKAFFQDSWAFSLGFDSAPYQSNSYLDISPVFFRGTQCEILNLHFVVLPIHEHHACSANFDLR